MRSLAFVVILLASSLSTWIRSGEQQANASEPDFVRGMRTEQFKAYTYASRRVEAALRNGTPPDAADLKWRDVGKTAVIAGDVRQVIRIEPLETLSLIDTGWVRRAEEASARVLSEFNQSGDRSVYADDDVTLLDAFVPATIAADRLRYTVESATRAGIPAQVASRGVPAAERILASFNSLGGSARFPLEDLDALMQLDAAVDRIEGPH